MGKNQVKLIDRWAQDSEFEVEEDKEKTTPEKTSKSKTFNQIINNGK